MDMRCKDHPFSIVDLVLTPELTHYGRYECSECHRWIAWAPKPENNDIARRQSARLKKIFEKEGIDYCQMCFRTKDSLSSGVVFVVHHIIEVQDGGPDDLWNLWHVCSTCHRLIHLMHHDRANKDWRPAIETKQAA